MELLYNAISNILFHTKVNNEIKNASMSDCEDILGTSGLIWSIEKSLCL